MGTATATTATTTTGATTTGSSAVTTATCLGQMVQPLQNWLTCNDLCDTYEWNPLPLVGDLTDC